MKKGFSILLCHFLFFVTAVHSAWDLPAVPISSGGAPFSPAVGMDANGNAVAIWASGMGPISVIQGSTLEFCSSTWTPTNDLSSTTSAFTPQVAVSSGGDSVAVWLQFNGIINEIRGATLASGSSTWVSTTVLSPAGQSSNAPQVAISPTGYAVAVWVTNDGSNFIIEGAVLAPGSSVWTPTTNLSVSGLDSSEPQISMDASGNAVAVWTLNNGGVTTIQGSKLAVGSTTWTPTTNLSGGILSSFSPQVAVDDSGNAIAAWITSDTSTIVQGARLASGSTTWVSTTDISVTPTNTESFDLAISPAGQAVLVRNEDGIIRGSVLNAGSLVWVPTSDLSLVGANSPQVDIDNAGKAVAVWTYTTGDTIVQSADLALNSLIWTAPVDLTSSGFASTPRITTVRPGYAVAIWIRNGVVEGATTLITAAEASTVIAVPTTVTANGVDTSFITVTLQDCSGPIVGHIISLTPSGGSSVITPVSGATDAFGQVVFSVTDTVAETITYTAIDVTGGFSILQTATVTFVGASAPPLPPSNLRATKTKNEFLTQIDRINMLTWTASPDPTVVGYRIYQDGIVVAEVGRGHTTALIHNRRKKVLYTYYLVSFNASNLESTPIAVTISG